MIMGAAGMKPVNPNEVAQCAAAQRVRRFIPVLCADRNRNVPTQFGNGADNPARPACMQLGVQKWQNRKQ